MEKPALTDASLHPLLKRRWSPTAFADRPISPAHLASLFEAARWSASCFNEQPWNFVLAARHTEPEAFQALVSCMTPGNAAWVQHAPVLMYSVAKLHFDKNGKPNAYAWYDTGQALAHLSIQAMDLGVFVHQMAGWDAAKAKAVMQVPDTHQVVSAIAMGYGLEADQVPTEAKAREESPRVRRPVAAFLHRGTFGVGPGPGFEGRP